METILDKNLKRYTLFPIEHQDIWELYKVAQSSFWIAEEIDFTVDIPDWENKLTDNERYFIKNILAFFAFSDGIVNDNLAINFMDEVELPEAKCLYGFQIAIENIHAEVYSLMIDTYITDNEEKLQVFDSFNTNPVVSKKAKWALKWLDSEKNTFPERLLAFGIVEGVFFSASFAAIFWLKSRGLMPSLSHANELIARDESQHCLTAVLLYSKLKYKLSEKKVHEMFMEAFLIEKEFITESLPVSLIGMNSNDMVTYIQFICDFWLIKFGYSKIFNVKNPFSFMDYSALEIKTNFFEKYNSQYSKSGVGKKPEDMKFSLDAEF
jgi:ribonucleoside-diphosphate reductase beta chain